MRLKVLWLGVILAAVSGTMSAQESIDPAHNYVNSQLPFHAVTLDSTGKLIPWYEPDKPWL